MYMSVLHACVCVCVPCAFKGQKAVSNSLELEYRWFVSCHMSAGTKPRSSAKAASAINTKPSLQPAPRLIIF